MSQRSPLGPSRLTQALAMTPTPAPNAGLPLQMTNPAIQNDFSYYRRTISRNRINNLQVRG